MAVLHFLGKLLAGYLTGPSSSPYASPPTDMAALAKAVRPGDVVLVDGKQRVSTAIKYLTQSTWSHAALCIKAQGAEGATPCFVEADAADGVRIVGLSEFDGLHCRICRPVGLSDEGVHAVINYAVSRVGDAYDLANVVDLARYLCPTPPVPTAWRRRMIALGSGEPSKAICSTLIAKAFQSVRYPILPHVTQELRDDPECKGCVRDILHIRHFSLFTPRDFDVSPYFAVVKPSLEAGFDLAAMQWADLVA